MTRKDFRLIALAVQRLPQCEQKMYLIDELSFVLKRSNTRFSPALFKAACLKELDSNWVK